MFDAQILWGQDEVYTPWFSRQGDNVTFSADVMVLFGTFSQLRVECYTKPDEETGDGTLVGSGTNMRVTGVHHVDWEEMSQLVRFKFENDASPMAVGAYILFSSLDLVWYDTVFAG
jgi:hypothetical protein